MPPPETRQGDVAPQPQLPPIFGLGKWWTGLGTVLLLFCLASTIEFIAHYPFIMSGGLRGDPRSMVTIWAWITSGFATMSWITVDVIDRRKRFVWLLPVLGCGLAGLTFIPLAFYLLVGRRAS